jgi:hypothetical protein
MPSLCDFCGYIIPDYGVFGIAAGKTDGTF